MTELTRCGSQATLRPFEYSGKCYNGHELALAQMDAIYSVGRSPEAAVRALARARRWGKVVFRGELGHGERGYTWGLRFAVGKGQTSMKAAGIHVPGGVVCTWWV